MAIRKMQEVWIASHLLNSDSVLDTINALFEFIENLE